MQIQVIASGSTGNCYKVSDGQTSLLLECGIPVQKIKESLGFRLSAIDGCLITHSHKDHCKAAKDLIKAGIDVYMSFGTLQELGLDGHRVKVLVPGKPTFCGSFYVHPFLVEHDTSEPLGFVVQSTVANEKLLFLTDTYYCRYKVPGLTHIMIECNYSKESIDPELNEERHKRLLRSHMSLETCKEFLLVNDLSQVKGIWLIHLSNQNSDAERFKVEIQALTGKLVYV